MEFKKAVGLGIIIFMALSVFGYVGSSFFSEDENQKEYNGFTFYKSNVGWQTRVGDKTYRFTYLPSDLANISFSGPTKEILFANRIYLIYEPGNSLDTVSAMNTIGSFFYQKGTAINKACSIEEGCPDIPIKDCSENLGILFEKSEELALETRDGCVVLKADNSFDLNKLSERLIYSLLGII